MLIDHVGITVSNYEQAKKFYTQILAPLGLNLVTEHEGWVGFGKKDKAEFWFGQGRESNYFSHIAFQAETKEAIDLFYQVAIEEGALCKAKPKLRHDYYPQYYGAFVIDSDGHHIGAVLVY